MKNFAKTLAPFALAAVLCLAAAPAATASSSDEITGFNVSQALMVGSVRLEPGNYLIRVVAAGPTHNLLQVTDSEQTRVYATVLATPRQVALDAVTPSSALAFSAPAGSRPASLKSWTIANSRFGFDFYAPGASAELLAAGSFAPATLVALAR